MGRAPCYEKNNGLKKGPWTPEEDQKLINYIHKHGYGNWRLLPKNAGLQRCGKSCRLRWTNYLRPDIKRGRFSFEEEEAIIHLHTILGNKWSAIASRLPGRTDNEIKNYWNTHIRKRLLRMGIDPVTHAPRLDLLDDISSILSSSNSSSLYGTHQLMVNPDDILNLASSLFSSSHEQQEEINNQLLGSTPQIDHQSNPHFLLQNQDPYSVLTPAASVSILPLTQAESNANTSMLFDFDFQQLSSNPLCHEIASTTATTEDYHLPNYNFDHNNHVVNEVLLLMDPHMSETSTFHSNYNNLSFPSSLLSTPLNSNSMYVNGSSSTEDETSQS